MPTSVRTLSLVTFAAWLVTGCGPSNEPDIDTFRLLDTSTSPAQSVFSHSSKTGPEWAWEGDELGTAPANPLGSTRVVYHSDSDRTEVDLFARDPDEMLHTLVSLPFPIGYTFDAWDAQVSEPAALPWVLGIPYPDPHALLGDDSPQEFQLSKGLFFKNDAPVGPAAAPAGQSSVKAAFLYNHGMCSRVQSLDDVIEQLGDELFDNVAAGVQSADPTDCTDAIQHFTRVSTYVTHRPDHPHDLRGGFVMSSWMQAKFNGCFSYCYLTPLGPICEDKCDGNDTLLTYEFEFGLTGVTGFQNGPGILTVTPKKQYFAVNGDLSWILSGIIQSRIEHEVPSRVQAQAMDAQSQDVLDAGDDDGRCDISSEAHQCIQAANKFAGIAQVGALNLGLTFKQQEDLGKTITDKDPFGGMANWQCSPRPTPTDPFAGRCEFIVRAERVNVYPDELELVWFDEPDVSSTAFAAYAATFAAPPDSSKYADALRARGELCAYDPAQEIGGDRTYNTFRQRAFSTYSDDYRIAKHAGSFCFRDPGGW